MRRLTVRACLLGFFVVSALRANAARPVDARVLSGLTAPLAPGAPLTIPNLVLEDGSEIALDVRRFEPFTADAKVVVHGTSGETTSPLSSDPYFIGTVAGDPLSFVFLAGGVSPRGMISASGKLIVLGSETDAYRSEGVRETFLHTPAAAELGVPESMRGWK